MKTPALQFPANCSGILDSTQRRAILIAVGGAVEIEGAVEAAPIVEAASGFMRILRNAHGQSGHLRRFPGRQGRILGMAGRIPALPDARRPLFPSRAMTTHALQFAAPQWLWITAAALALTAALFWVSAKARRRQLAEFADAARRADLLASHSPARRLVKNALLFLALLLVGLALARPQWGETEERVNRQGDDVVFLIDASKSMLATDVTPSRLERAKMAVLDFLRRHAGGRVGLVAFAGDAFLQCPLTLDYDAFEESIRDLDTDSGTRPRHGHRERTFRREPRI